MSADMGTRRIIVSGTDTDVGKTVLAALALLALDADYWKPVQSGLEGETDTETVARLTGFSRDRFHPEAYRLRSPMSPDQSAAIDGIRIERARLAPPESTRGLVIEGAGGAMVPLSDDLLQIDMFAAWKAPVLLAARSGLGTLNHTLLTVEALRRRNIPVAGIAMIGAEHPMNRRTLERWCEAPVIGILPCIERLDRASLIAAYRDGFRPADEWIDRHE